MEVKATQNGILIKDSNDDGFVIWEKLLKTEEEIRKFKHDFQDAMFDYINWEEI